MPSLKKHVWAPVFFMCFIMIGNYFIGSLVRKNQELARLVKVPCFYGFQLLSVVFNSFKKKFKKKFGNLYRHRRRGLRLAFKAVCQENSNEMDFNTFKGAIAGFCCNLISPLLGSFHYHTVCVCVRAVVCLVSHNQTAPLLI